MNNLIKTAKRLGTSAILLLGTCLTATAQSVAPTPSTPAATAGVCVPSNAANYSYTFTPGTGTLTGWYTLGDFQIATGQAATANPILVNSTGPGRGRIVARYNAGATCPQETSYQVNKTFAQPANIEFLGPDCVELGKAYGFVLPPIVSTAALINATIGIDIYDWDISRGAYGSNAGFPAGSTVVFSGDRSAVSLTLPVSFTGASYELRAKIGTCNPASPYMTKTIYIKPNTVSLTAVTNSPATCKTDNAPFSLSFYAQAGPTYTWNGLPAGWVITSAPNATFANGSYTYTAAGAQTITITPNSPVVADISVTAKNGTGTNDCASATSNVFRVSRQLNSTDNAISASVSGCLTPGSTVTFSFNHAFPLNTVFEWLLPTGWAVSASTTNSATVVVGSQPGNVTARVLGCTTGGTVRAVTVTGNYGCLPANYVITRYGGAMVYFEVTNPSAAPGSLCKPVAGAGITYEWSSTANPNPAHTTVTTPYISFANMETIGNSVSVIIKNTNAANPCFAVTVTQPVNRMALGSSSPTAATDPVVAYPNPVGSELHIDLNGKKGTTQLVLTDALGRTVQQTTTTEGHTKLDVRSLPAGTYLLRATLPDGKSVGQPVQIQH